MCHFRNELHIPRLAFVDRWAPWVQQGSQTMRDRARQRVADLLAQPAECRLPPDKQQALMELQTEWMRRIGQ